jgi:uncharacterized protein YndB with AHSA1/START domain
LLGRFEGYKPLKLIDGLMADLKFSIDIAVPPNEVFAFFVPQRMPLWYGAEMKACFEVEGGASEFARGQKVRITGDLKGREMSLTTVITAYQWEKLLEWQFQDSYGIRGLQRWELAEVSRETRGTRVTLTDSYRMPGFYGRIADVILTRFAVSLRDRSWLDRLQHLAMPLATTHVSTHRPSL